jgi:hypothetical protein
VGSSDIRLANNYITAPLLFRAQFGKRAKVFFDAGAYGGFLISATSTVRRLTSKSTNIGTVDITQYRNLFDHGFCGGLGLEVPLRNNNKVSLGFRYNHGQVNMQNDTRSIPLYNRSLNLNIGISQAL